MGTGLKGVSSPSLGIKFQSKSTASTEPTGLKGVSSPGLGIKFQSKSTASTEPSTSSIEPARLKGSSKSTAFTESAGLKGVSIPGRNPTPEESPEAGAAAVP